MMKLFNALAFQAGWWACIASVGLGLELEAIVFCIGLIGLHLYLANTPWLEVKMGVIALLLGILLDTGLQYFSVVDFYGWALGSLSPFWLWALWLMFASTLNSSLSFLQKLHPITTGILGLVFGPLTYYAGAKLGAADLDASVIHLSALAVVWMFAMPFLVFTAQQLSLTFKDNS